MSSTGRRRTIEALGAGAQGFVQQLLKQLQAAQERRERQEFHRQRRQDREADLAIRQGHLDLAREREERLRGAGGEAGGGLGSDPVAGTITGREFWRFLPQMRRAASAGLPFEDLYQQMAMPRGPVRVRVPAGAISDALGLPPGEHELTLDQLEDARFSGGQDAMFLPPAQARAVDEWFDEQIRQAAPMTRGVDQEQLRHIYEDQRRRVQAETPSRPVAPSTPPQAPESRSQVLRQQKQALWAAYLSGDPEAGQVISRTFGIQVPPTYEELQGNPQAYPQAVASLAQHIGRILAVTPGAQEILAPEAAQGQAGGQGDDRRNGQGAGRGPGPAAGGGSTLGAQEMLGMSTEEILQRRGRPPASFFAGDEPHPSDRLGAPQPEPAEPERDQNPFMRAMRGEGDAGRGPGDAGGFMRPPPPATQRPSPAPDQESAEPPESERERLLDEFQNLREMVQRARQAGRDARGLVQRLDELARELREKGINLPPRERSQASGQ